MTKIEKKERLTRQRMVVLEELRKVFSHPTAAELHLMAQGRLPNIALATVYRVLDFLIEKELIIKLNSKSLEGEARFDANVDRHLHLVCSDCGKIQDLDVVDFDLNFDEIDSSGFVPHLDYLEIPGLCKECVSKV